ncbi:MAG: hypothetical protein KGJ84_16350, partial [Elusimicrobia bacterium]|nr:hypothetical protein [Elusimicrobiota bacterium]
GLRNELDKIKGVSIQHDETRTTDRAPHLWQWSFVYEIESFSGMFTVWITPSGSRKALMIAELIEFSGHENGRGPRSVSP